MNRIYLDMDDVLADFTGKLKKYGIDKERATDEEIMIPLEQDIETFFLDLDPIDGITHFAELYHNSYSRIGVPVKILTATPPGMDDTRAIVYKQKLSWLEKWIPGFDWVDLLVVPYGSKAEYAYRKNILVDDSLSNIEGWNKEGGLGIHYHPSLFYIKNRVNMAKNIVHLIENICK